MEETPLSTRVLDEVRELGGDRLVRELLQIFVGRTPARLRAMRAAVAGGDLVGAERALHSLRSAAGTIGAERMAAAAANLERAARRGAVAELEDGLEVMERETAAAVAASRRLCAQPDD